MLRQTEQLKQKLEEMLASNDTEWVNTVTVTLNAVYRRFQLEQQDGKQIIPLGTRRTSQPGGRGPHRKGRRSVRSLNSTMSHRGLLVAQILTRWDQLLPADLQKIHLDSDQLAQLLQTRYGFCERRAKREAGSFLADFAERLRRAAA